MSLRLLVVFLISAFAFASSSFGQYRALPERPKARTDRIIVKFKPDQAPAGDQRRHGHVYRRFPALGIEVIQLDGSTSVEKALETYRADNRVVYAQPDHIRAKDAAPDDPGTEDGDPWHILNDGRELGKIGADISASAAWDIRHDAGDVVVAVLDTGIRHTHEDLAANMWTNAAEFGGQHGVDDDGNGIIDDIYGANLINNTGASMDDEGHGTFVAGLIGAVGNNGKGVTGVCWSVKLMAVKVLDASGGGSDSDIIAGMEYARQQGAKIINASLGRTGGPSPALEDAATALANSGVILVVAAGNEAYDNDFDLAFTSYPASLSHPNVVTVAATTRNDLLATFSNFGWRSVDLGAPGVAIPSTSSESDTSYDVLSGTSMSTPLVSGALALLTAHLPSSSVQQRIERLLNAVDPVPALAGRATSGGRLNVARALQGSAVAPVNDAFSRAIPLGSDISFAGTGVTRAASTEPNEPFTGNYQFSRRSLWFTWTAPFFGWVKILPARHRDPGVEIPPIVTVYTDAPSVGQVQFVATNAPSGGATAAPFYFEARPQQRYYISLENGQEAGSDTGFYGIYDVVPEGFTGYSLLYVDAYGPGTITPGKLLGDTIHKQGKQITLKSKPAAGYILHSWVDPTKPDGEGILSRSPVYKFRLEGSPFKVVQAVFDVNPFTDLKGQYSGFATLDDNGRHAAFFIMKLGGGGSFTGTIRIGKKTHRFKGTFLSDRKLTVSIPQGRNAPLVLELSLSRERRITGTITVGSAPATLLAESGGFSSWNNPALNAGDYTVLLPVSSAVADQPEGAGYGLLTISPSGNIRFSGVLGDGRKVSQGTGLYRTGYWPLFFAPYKKGGLAAGLVAFDEAKPTSDWSGELEWEKSPSAKDKTYPGGFSGVRIALEGSRYRRPSPGERLLAINPSANNARVTLNGAGISQKEFLITIDSQNAVAPSPDLSMGIFVSTGEFAANFIHEAKVYSFHGMVSQKANKGAGYFLKNKRSGSLVLEAE